MPAPRRTLLAGACLATAAGVAFLARRGEERPPEVEPAAERVPLATLDAPSPRQEPVPSEPAAAKLEELRASSETYRGTTFLTAIRSAGFVCYDLAGVYGGFNDSATWTVSCADMLAYTVRVDASGALVVEPAAQYLDGLSPAAPRDDGPRRGPPQPLEPR